MAPAVPSSTGGLPRCIARAFWRSVMLPTVATNSTAENRIRASAITSSTRVTRVAETSFAPDGTAVTNELASNRARTIIGRATTVHSHHRWRLVGTD